MTTIINLSQRAGGINDMICDAMVEEFNRTRVVHRYIKIRELSIGICSNCRACMKNPGNELGVCTLSDDMQNLLASILASHCLIVSSPINCYDLPSIVRVMLERMSVFCYWNDEMYSPKVRDTGKNIKGVLITTSALPGIMVPIVTQVRKTFRLFAKPLRIKKIQYYHLGFKGRKADMTFSEKDARIVQKIVNNLSAHIISSNQENHLQ